MKWSESDLDLMKPRDTLETLHFSDNSSDLSDTVDHKKLKIRKVWSKMLNFDKKIKVLKKVELWRSVIMCLLKYFSKELPQNIFNTLTQRLRLNQNISTFSTILGECREYILVFLNHTETDKLHLQKYYCCTWPDPSSQV